MEYMVGITRPSWFPDSCNDSETAGPNFVNNVNRFVNNAPYLASNCLSAQEKTEIMEEELYSSIEKCETRPKYQTVMDIEDESGKYYTLDEAPTCDNLSGITILSWNSRSLADPLKLEFLQDNECDLICIQETWLSCHQTIRAGTSNQTALLFVLIEMMSFNLVMAVLPQ